MDPLDLDGNGETGYDAWGWPKADPKNPYQQATAYSDGLAPENFDPEPDGIFDEYQIYQTDRADYITYQVDAPSKGISAGDPVVTAAGDTLRGYLLPRGMSYMFDGDDPTSGENDTGERTNATPIDGFVGTRCLYIPGEWQHEDEYDTWHKPYSHQWWNWESDPGSDQEKFEYMTGTHSLSDGMRYMPHPFDYQAGAPVFDYRYMITYGPYSMAENEVLKFVMVTGVGKGIQGLRENMDNALEAYYTGEWDFIGDPMGGPEEGSPNYAAYQEQLGFTGASNSAVALDKHFTLPIPPPIPTLNYSAGDGSVNLVWDNSAENAVDSFIGAVDFEGYKVYRSKYNAQNWEVIAAFDLADVGPTYLRNTEGDTINPIDLGDGTVLTLYDEGYAEAKEGEGWSYVMVDLPNVTNDYIDVGGDFVGKDGEVIFQGIEQPINGLKYYYAVVAYDPDKPARGLTSIESAKSNYRKTLGGAPDPVIPRTDTAAEDNLDNVKVVPNPYKGTALFESRYEDRISFINLPPRCKISIFSLTGDLVDEIYKEDATTGAVYWDLISRNEQKVVSGLYIYAVETPGGEKKIGKFLIIR